MTEALVKSEAVDEEAMRRFWDELGQAASIAAIFERRVAEHPHKIALQTPEHEFTYEQVNGWANRVAYGLHRELSLGDGPVALWLENDLAVAASLMGVWKAGRAFMTGNLQAPDMYNRTLFSTVVPAAIVTERRLQPQLVGLVPEGTPMLFWEDVEAHGFAENLGLTIAPNSLFRIIFTSGSTGVPKGVAHDQRGMLCEAFQSMNGAFYRPTDRILQLSSLSHVNGSDLLFYTFMIGATLSCFPLQKWGVERLAQWIEEKHISFYLSVPTVFRHLTRLPQIQAQQFASIRVVHLGGESVRPADVRQFRRWFPKPAKLIANIGSTEAGSYARYVFSAETPIPEKLVPLGRPHAGINLQLWDENEELVEQPGEIGEIVVFAEGVARGYFGNPQLTAGSFRFDADDPTRRGFKTGDMAWMDRAGLLHSVGRKDRQVKIRGHRVELREIEELLVEFPGVTNSVAGAWSKGDSIMQLGVYYSVEVGTEVGESVLRDWLRERLPNYMVPQLFRRIEKWPTLASGKIDREALANPFPSTASTDQQGGGLVVTTDTEVKLLKIWQDVFANPDIEPTDNFFALGGDSLHATSLLSDIETAMGRRLSLEAIFATPNLRDLAAKIDAAPEVSGNFVRLGGRKGTQILLLVHGWGGTVTQFLDLAHSLRFDGPIVGLQGNEQTGRIDRPDSVPRLAEYYAELILREYPDKRYVLAGYSAGGVLAYTIAAALRAKGHPVELLIALDSRPNGVPLRRRGGMMWPYVRSRFSFHWQRLKGLRSRALWEYLTGRAQASLNLAKSVARPVAIGQDYYIDLLCRHRLEPCDIPMAVVQCDQTREQLTEGWQYLTGRYVRSYLFHGSHEQILRSDAVVEVASLLERILTDHQSRQK